MALLDCICCWRHRSRTGACWDSPDEFSPRMFTYSCLIEHAQEIRRTLISSNRTAPQASLGPMLSHDDSHSKSRAPVGIYGRGCPEVLCAILGIMAIPAPYMPLDLCQLPANRWRTLSTCGVNTLLIELSLFCVSSLKLPLLYPFSDTHTRHFYYWTQCLLCRISCLSSTHSQHPLVSSNSTPLFAILDW